MARHWLATIALALLPTTGAALAETPIEAANRAFADQQWQVAADLYRQVADAEATNFQAPLRLGVALLHLERAPEALVWIEQAEQRGAPPAAAGYRKGAAYAALGDPAAAIRELRRAVAAGLPLDLQADPLLASLRGSPEFAAVIAEQDRLRHPCRNDPRYRAFDYWLGEWDVVANNAPPGSPVSENILTLEYDGCVIQEHWQAANGGTGSSFNIFDASRNRWHQTWVDSSGGLQEYDGNPDGAGNLVFHGELAAPAGSSQPVATRMSFLKLGPDQVRQLIERSTDGGKNWTVSYDLIYTRRKPKP